MFCAQCLKDLPENSFDLDKRNNKLKSRCRNCLKNNILRSIRVYKQSEEYKKKHKEYENLRYAKNLAYREKKKDAWKAYRKSHTFQVYETHKNWVAHNKNRVLEYHRTYQSNLRKTSQSYNEYQRIYKLLNRPRNTRNFSNGGDIKKEHLIHLHVWQENHCYYCNNALSKKKVSPQKSTLEHIVPLNRGGHHSPQNTVLVCAHCNYSKQDKLIHLEWNPDFIHPKPQVFSASSQFIAKELQSLLGVSVEFYPETGVISLNDCLKIFILSSFWGSSRTDKFPENYVPNLVNQGIPVFLDWEWFQHKAAILTILKAKLKQYNSIFARKTQVEKTLFSKIRPLLEQNHLQGSGIGGVSYCLRDSSGIIQGAASFVFHQKYWELNRLVFLTHVQGGFSKLITAFFRDYPGVVLQSYVDTRIGTGESYVTVGFQPMGQTHTHFGYISPVGMFHRLQFAKHKLKALDYFNPEKTELDLTGANGIYRWYGSPQLKFMLCQNSENQK